MLLIEKKSVLFNNRKLTSPHSSPLNNLNHCTARQNHYQRLRYILTSHSMFTVFLFLSSHRFMWPIHTETQRFISWNMKRATEQREIFTSSVSVLRSPLDDAKSKYISSNQTARYEGNRGDLPTLCVWIGFKQYQSVYRCAESSLTWVTVVADDLGCASKPEKRYLYEQYIEEWGHQGTSDSNCMRSFSLEWLHVDFDSIVDVSFTVHNPKRKKRFLKKQMKSTFKMLKVILKKQFNLKLKSGHLICRWVCFFIRTNGEILHYITCSPMDRLQWMGAVRMSPNIW